MRRPIYPLVDRPTPILDIVRGKIESSASPFRCLSSESAATVAAETVLSTWKRTYPEELVEMGVRLADRWMKRMAE